MELLSLEANSNSTIEFALSAIFLNIPILLLFSPKRRYTPKKKDSCQMHRILLNFIKILLKDP